MLPNRDGCGCTDILAFNFDAAAIHDDSSCSYAPAATAYMYDERNATADFETVSGCYAIGPPGVRPLVKNCAISGNLPYHFGGKRYSLNDCSFAQEDSACYEVIDNWNQGSMDVEHTFGPWQQLEISGPAVVGGATFDGAVVGLNPVPVGLPWPSPITQPWGTWGAIENGAAIQMAPFATNVAPVNCQTCQTCQLTIFDSTFTKMYAGSIHPFSGADSAPELSSQTGFGGAVFQFGSVFSSTGTPTCGGKEQTMTVLRSTFDSNSAFSSGGAIYQGAGGSMNVSLSNFISNTAMYGNGGAIYTGGTLIVWRSTFTSNEASRGGAIYVAKNGVLAILLCLFAFNTGASGGAVGTAIGSSVTISLSGFASNSATDGSGAHLYLDGPESFAIRDVPFTPFVPGSSSVSASGLGSCEIHPCPLGHGCSYTNYSLACAPCASGTVGVDGIRCSLCQPGEEPNANQTQCKPCSGATISQFGVECVQCDDVVDQEKTSCSECQAGKEPNGDRTACVNCVGATFSTSGTCRTCDQPNVVDAAHITCTKCSPGEEPNTNWTQCLACLGNTFSQFGNDCTACAPGLASNSNHTACDDLNECITKNGGCDPISTCQGQNGGVCSDPSKTTATTCNALNATWMPDCSKGCTNLEGSYRCGVCPNGFIKSDIFDNVTSRLMGSLCVSPPPPPAGSSETNVLPSATMQITASAAALQQGSKAQLQLVAALQADLAASLGVDPSEITISNINAAGSRRRVLQSGGTAVEFEFVIDSPDASAQDLLATLKQQLQNSSSPLMTGSVSELGYSIPAAQADALSFTFTCPPGTIQGAGTTCQLCPQMPKAQYTDDSETCKQCPVNQQVNAKGTGCSCADGHYDASLGPLICYAVGESWAAADFGAAVAGQTDCSNCPALCMPCGELASCVSCTGGIATLNAGAATSEDSKSAAIGLAPTNGIVGPLAMFVCPSNGCLAQNAAGNNGSWLSPCEKGYVGALCSACDTDANFVKDGATCDACADSASPEYFAWLVAIVVVATVIFCAANKLNSEKAQDVMVSEPEPPPEQEPEDATSTAANKTKAAKALATSNTASAVAGAVAASVADKLKSGGNGSGDVASIVALSMVQVKILIGVFQISSELPTVLQIDYPESFNQLLTAVGVLMVDIFEVFKLDCVSPLSLHTRFVCVMLMPPVCIGLVQLLRVFANCRISNGSTYAEGADQTSEPSVVQRKAANRSKADYRSAFVVVLLYPLLCRTCFRMYACKELSETEGWHPDDFTIACNDSVHYFFLLLATIGVIVYPIGIPAGFMFILHRDKRKTDAGGTPSASLEFLRVDYKPDCYYYECVTLAEKLLITGLLSFVEQGSIFQTFCGSCIAFYFFGHALYTWPFVHAMDNVLKIVAEAQLFLTLLIRCDFLTLNPPLPPSFKAAKACLVSDSEPDPGAAAISASSCAPS
jgi:predicted outer membrane repeat protein